MPFLSRQTGEKAFLDEPEGFRTDFLGNGGLSPLGGRAVCLDLTAGQQTGLFGIRRKDFCRDFFFLIAFHQTSEKTIQRAVVSIGYS